MQTYIPRFSLSALCALLFVGQRLCPTLSLKCAHSSIQIYTPKHTRDHEECMRVLATCAMHFLLAGQPSPFMRRARAGPRWNFIPFSAICYDELFGIRRWTKVIGKPRSRDRRVFFVKWKCFVELFFDNAGSQAEICGDQFTFEIFVIFSEILKLDDF